MSLTLSPFSASVCPWPCPPLLWCPWPHPPMFYVLDLVPLLGFCMSLTLSPSALMSLTSSPYVLCPWPCPPSRLLYVLDLIPLCMSLTLLMSLTLYSLCPWSCLPVFDLLDQSSDCSIHVLPDIEQSANSSWSSHQLDIHACWDPSPVQCWCLVWSARALVTMVIISCIKY